MKSSNSGSEYIKKNLRHGKLFIRDEFSHAELPCVSYRDLSRLEINSSKPTIGKKWKFYNIYDNGTSTFENVCRVRLSHNSNTLENISDIFADHWTKKCINKINSREKKKKRKKTKGENIIIMLCNVIVNNSRVRVMPISLDRLSLIDWNWIH